MKHFFPRSPRIALLGLLAGLMTGLVLSLSLLSEVSVSSQERREQLLNGASAIIVVGFITIVILVVLKLSRRL